MEDLLENQIRSSCRLALPEGLKELMCDISREVLRAQPQNLYDFIANYLSVLLLSREHLSISHHLCDTVCATSCYKELEDELRFLGLEDEKIPDVKKIIMEHFCSDDASQNKLMKKMVEEFDMTKEQINAVCYALHKAFKRHLINKTTYYESSTDSEMDEVDLAAKHTLKIFRKTNVTNEEYRRAVDNVKASYRAFGVIRHEPNENDHESQTQEESESNDTESDKPRNIRFHSKEISNTCEPFTTKKLSTVSSSTLAGSYMNLPEFVPYSVYESNLQPVHETLTEHVDNIEKHESKGHQKISFQDPELDDHAELADIESYSDVEEVTSFNSQCSYVEEFFGNCDHADFNEEIEQYAMYD